MNVAGGAAHLYVHVPFCAQRCGYCDFVTAVGRHGEHGPYVDALLRELELQRGLLLPELETVYLGGGTPTYLEPSALRRLLGALPAAIEVTVEANPETATPELAALLVEHGVNRVSLGAQTFQRELLATLERRVDPQTVSESLQTLRAAGLDNVSLDLIYGIPGQSADQLARDLERIADLAPEHVSAYELEAKPGTRFTHAHGAELERQSEALEDYMELVTRTLRSEGYRWYETASFCRREDTYGRDLRSRHNLGYWLAHDYIGIGVGAVSTLGCGRWRNGASLGRYAAARRAGERPPSEYEPIAPTLRLWEHAMLGLRLEEGLDEALIEPVLDSDGLDRMIEARLVVRDAGSVRLTDRGRLLGGGVTVELLVDPAELDEVRSDAAVALSATP